MSYRSFLCEHPENGEATQNMKEMSFAFRTLHDINQTTTKIQTKEKIFKSRR